MSGALHGSRGAANNPRRASRHTDARGALVSALDPDPARGMKVRPPSALAPLPSRRLRAPSLPAPSRSRPPADTAPLPPLAPRRGFAGSLGDQEAVRGVPHRQAQGPALRRVRQGPEAQAAPGHRHRRGGERARGDDRGGGRWRGG